MAGKNKQKGPKQAPAAQQAPAPEKVIPPVVCEGCDEGCVECTPKVETPVAPVETPAPEAPKAEVVKEEAPAPIAARKAPVKLDRVADLAARLKAHKDAFNPNSVTPESVSESAIRLQQIVKFVCRYDTPEVLAEFWEFMRSNRELVLAPQHIYKGFSKLPAKARRKLEIFYSSFTRVLANRTKKNPSSIDFDQVREATGSESIVKFLSSKNTK